MNDKHMTGRVAGKVALITGAAQGLGMATARMLAAEGAHLVVTDINEKGVTDLAAEIGGDTLALCHDVTREDDWIRVMDAVKARFGHLNILVNNAGIGGMGSVESATLEDWRHIHAVNLDSVFLGCKYALPLMKAHKGSIVNISSIAGMIAAPLFAAYNSSKAAVRHLSKSIALHCAKEGYDVRCNSVHPVFIDTPILDGMLGQGDRRAQGMEKLARQIPMGRVGEANDVAYAVLFLASDESQFVTGSELKVDGGISAM